MYQRDQMAYKLLFIASSLGTHHNKMRIITRRTLKVIVTILSISQTKSKPITNKNK